MVCVRLPWRRGPAGPRAGRPTGGQGEDAAALCSGLDGGGGGIARSRGASGRAGGEASPAGSPGTPSSVVAFLSLDRGER